MWFLYGTKSEKATKKSVAKMILSCCLSSHCIEKEAHRVAMFPVFFVVAYKHLVALNTAATDTKHTDYT